MKIKWNWGWGIVIAIILFMALTLVRVIFFMNKDVDLVTDHYYDKEIKYQQQIDKEKRALEPGENVQVNYSGEILSLTFPADSSITGNLYFYRPSDSHRDFNVRIRLDEKFSQLINVSKLDKGLWKLQINWSVNKTDYYAEKTLMLN